MTLYQLRILLSVSRFQSVTRAARHLHVSQPAISRQLRLFEDELRQKLFRKTPHGIELTNAGESILETAKHIVAEVDRLEQRNPYLSVGACNYSAAVWLASVISKFAQSHQDLHINFEAGRTPALEAMVADSELDLALVSDPPTHPSLAHRELFRERPVLLASKRSEFVKRHRMTLGDLATAPLIVQRVTREGSVNARVLRELESYGITPNIVVQTNSPSATLAAVHMDVGLALVLPSMVQALGGQNQMKIIEIQGLSHVASFHVVYRTDGASSPSAQAFLECLHEVIQNTQQAGHQRVPPTTYDH